MTPEELRTSLPPAIATILECVPPLVLLYLVSPPPRKRRKMTKEPLRCQHCGKPFTRQEHFDRHVRSHTGERPYPCRFPRCGKNFSRYDNMAQHLRNHAKDFPELQRLLEAGIDPKDAFQVTWESDPSLSQSHQGHHDDHDDCSDDHPSTPSSEAADTPISPSSEAFRSTPDVSLKQSTPQPQQQPQQAQQPHQAQQVRQPQQTQKLQAVSISLLLSAAADAGLPFAGSPAIQPPPPRPFTSMVPQPLHGRSLVDSNYVKMFHGPAGLF